MHEMGLLSGRWPGAVLGDSTAWQCSPIVKAVVMQHILSHKIWRERERDLIPRGLYRLQLSMPIDTPSGWPPFHLRET